MNYYDYIKDKRVIFVGGCHNLIGSYLNDFIDDYDIVVRSNGSIFLLDDDKYKIDYGTKCDVLYTNNQFYREMHPFNINDFKNKGVKYLRMKTCSKDYLKKLNNDINSNILTDTMRKVNKKTYGPVMGAYIFTDILDCKPEELFVTGIDFFISKYKNFKCDRYEEYFPGYLPDKIRKQGNEINIDKKEDGHNYITNTKYIQELYETHENMLMPSFIEDIMYEITSGKLRQKDD